MGCGIVAVTGVETGGPVTSVFAAPGPGMDEGLSKESG